MALTIKEIAKICGVSRGTVDRVIHQRPGVSPEIRDRIQAILDQVKYEPNSAAVALKRTDRNLTVGVVVPDRRNEFYNDVYLGIQSAARQCRGFGVLVEEFQMTQSTGRELVRGIDSLIGKGVDALAFQGRQEEIVAERLSGIPRELPVVTFNNDLPCPQRICFVGQDSLAAGRVAGQMMRLNLRKKGTVAILIGLSGLTHQMERVQGFRETVAGCSEILRLLEPIETHEDETVALNSTAQLIRDCPELVGIYAAGGGQKSIAAALAQSGRAEDVVMIGHDLLPKTVEYLQQGVVNCTIGQQPFLQGYQSVQILADYLMYHKKPALSRMLTMVDIRIRENAGFNGIIDK